MPNRIIKESICTSENIDSLSAFQETFFYRLIVNADDYGRLDARPKLLASKLFPLKEIRVSQIEDALRALTSAELVTLYTVDGKPFLQMNTWDRHQRIRNSKQKYPGIDEADAVAADCGELPQVAAKCGLNPIQSNPNTNPNPNPYYCTEQTDVSSMPVYELPLNDGSMFQITQDKYNQWLELYPAIDVMQELRNMRGWLDANPKNRKTKNGIMRFANGWLSRSQNRNSPHKKDQFDVDDYIRRLEEEERQYAEVRNSENT